MATATRTGTRDITYDLISVIYHQLQGAETYDRYIADARERNDDELAEFFGEVQEKNCEFAERGQRLLTTRLSV